ncbi:MAG: 50S ribosomal protein L29 [Caedimonas sp.]|nr:50S ribosomal protein L29 [Caedimonas sp.]
MKMDELRTKTEIELRDLVIQLRRELMNLRFQRSTDQLTAVARFRQARREIARIKTIVRQKQQITV